MRLPDLKYNFSSLPESKQAILFQEYWEKREKELDVPLPLTRRKLSSSSSGEKKQKGKTITLNSAQIELLRKLKLI